MPEPNDANDRQTPDFLDFLFTYRPLDFPILPIGGQPPLWRTLEELTEKFGDVEPLKPGEVIVWQNGNEIG